MLITHAPCEGKYDFMKKAFESGKPCAIFLPMLTMCTVKGSELIKRFPVTILPFARNVMFVINGRRVGFHMAWFCGNMGPMHEFINMKYLDISDITNDDNDSFASDDNDIVEELYIL